MAAAIAALISIAGAKSKPLPDAADVKKAEYIYLEAANARAEGRADDYLMLLRRAAALNPSDPYIAGALAEVNLALGGDSAAIEKAYGQLKARFEAMPTEPAYYSAVANVAQQLDRTDDLIDMWSKLDTLLPDQNDPAAYLASALITRFMKAKDSADYRRACAIYDRLENASGPTLPIIGLKVKAFSIAKDTAAIISAVTRLAQAAPADVSSNIYIGSAYDFLGMPDSVLHYFDRALAVDSTAGEVYLARAAFFREQGDSLAYDREVFRALNSPSLEFMQKLGLLTDYAVKLYTDSVQRPRIEHMFQTMQEQNPGEPELHALYGAYKAETGDMEAAAEQFSYSLDLDPEQHDVWANLLQVYGSENKVEPILPAARRALAVYPGDYYFTFMGASALASDSLYAEACALLDSVKPEEAPSREALSTLYSTKADFLYAMGLRDSAVTQYERAIELNAQNYLALNNCAYFLALDTLDLVKAELYATLATVGEPENPTYLDTYAWVLFMKKDYPKAREIMDRALVLLGIIEAPEGEPAKKDEEQRSSDIYDHAGDIYFMTGDHRKALEFWKEALKLDPADARIKKKVDHKAIFFD